MEIDELGDYAIEFTYDAAKAIDDDDLPHTMIMLLDVFNAACQEYQKEKSLGNFYYFLHAGFTVVGFKHYLNLRNGTALDNALEADDLRDQLEAQQKLAAEWEALAKKNGQELADAKDKISCLKGDEPKLQVVADNSPWSA